MADAPPHLGRVLADASAEHDRLGPAELGEIRPDVVLDAAHEEVDGERRAPVPVLAFFVEQVAHVAGEPGDAEQPRLLVQQGAHLAQAHALLEGDVLDEGGVDVAAAGAHHQPFERGEPHRRRDGTALPDCASRAAVAEVQGDEVDAVPGLAGKLGETLGEPGVRGAVEAVAADAVAAVELVRNGIEIGRLGHRRMEGGIEHRDHRDPLAEQGAGGPDAAQVGRVVQRGEVDAVLDPADDAGVDPGVASEALAAVHDTVADRVHVTG